RRRATGIAAHRFELALDVWCRNRAAQLGIEPLDHGHGHACWPCKAGPGNDLEAGDALLRDCRYVREITPARLGCDTERAELAGTYALADRTGGDRDEVNIDLQETGDRLNLAAIRNVQILRLGLAGHELHRCMKDRAHTGGAIFQGAGARTRRVD